MNGPKRWDAVPPQHRATPEFVRAVRDDGGDGGAGGGAVGDGLRCAAAERWDVDRAARYAPADPLPRWTDASTTRVYTRCPRRPVRGSDLCAFHGGRAARRESAPLVEGE